MKYFVTIAESGSLTKASQILGISHSGLSKAVTSLEAETKLKLFRPQGRGLEITQDGNWFYQKAQEILRIAGEMTQEKKEAQTLIRVGLSGVIAITCASLLTREIEAPMSLFEIDIGDVEGKILADELDFGVAFIPSPKPELEYLELGEVPFNSFAREDFLKKYVSEMPPFTVPISDFPINPLGYKNRDGWPIDVPRNPRFFVSGFAIALDLLRSGQSAIYMPDFVATLENERIQNENKIVKVREHKSAESRRKLFLVKRQSAEESKEMRRISKIVRRVCCVKN